MDYLENPPLPNDKIADLFRDTFAASEGVEEGALIAGLVQDIFATTAPKDIFVFAAQESGELAGCILFTRLMYPEDGRTVFMLSPVAVATSKQGQGIGQNLLNFGLDRLRAQNIEVVITYGDPNYYAKVGFHPVTVTDAQPPQNLQYPNGWLAQSLTSAKLTPLKGPSQSVGAFDNPAYW